VDDMKLCNPQGVIVVVTVAAAKVIAEIVN
jgi:hypothetical protein